MKVTHENMMGFVLNSIGLNASSIKSRRAWKPLFSAALPPFGAGNVDKKEYPNSVAHGDIEAIALTKVFSEDEIFMIYYGNWLRDYSQVLVPLMVGFGKVDRDFLLGKYRLLKDNRAALEVMNLIPLMHQKLSVSTWVKVLELLAAKEFVYNRKRQKGQRLKPAYNSYHDEFVATYGRLSLDMLGIYRPEEHIDNPDNLIDHTPFSDTSLKEPIGFNYLNSKGEPKYIKLYAGDDPKSRQVNLNKSFQIKPFVKGYDDPANTDQYQPSAKLRDPRPSSFTYFQDQIFLAANAQNKRDRLRYFGAALHVLEDYFAHSNFVEIALIKVDSQVSPSGINEDDNLNREGKKIRGTINVFPWVKGLPDEVMNMVDGKEKAKRIPLVTGSFGSWDTIASIAPKLEEELFPTTKTPYTAMKVRQRTFGERFAEIVLEDLARKELEYKKEKGLEDSGVVGRIWDIISPDEGDDRPLSARIADVPFEPGKAKDMLMQYLNLRDDVIESAEDGEVDDELEKTFEVMHNTGENVAIPFNGLIMMIAKPVSPEAIKEIQGVVDFGTDPTHTQVAKDEPDHRLNPLAGLLAIEAVREVGIVMKSIWETKQFNAEELCTLAETKYFAHPSEVDWMDSMVAEWAKANPDAIANSETATRTEHYYNRTIELYEDLNKYFNKSWKGISDWWDDVKIFGQ
ncbi:MAG: hypothetical protein K9J17_08485 [Flavobacteriales bacterium]|nr:hypothetical protein [Flavobacteriales bacterium]